MTQLVLLLFLMQVMKGCQVVFFYPHQLLPPLRAELNKINTAYFNTKAFTIFNWLYTVFRDVRTKKKLFSSGNRLKQIKAL